MKKTTLLLCLVYALFFACSEEEQPQVQKNERVQFNLDLLSSEKTNGRVAAEIPAGAVASVEISGPSGIVTEELEILKFGESYLTSPIELPVGTNRVISFIIIGEKSEVLYAAPKEGSPLAPYVSNALPRTFNIAKGKINNLTIQVIEVSDRNPEAFGYASFGIEVVKPLSISVFIEENGILTLTNSLAIIHTGDLDEPLQSLNLTSKVNSVSFEGNDTATYFLTVQKPEYTTTTISFRYDQLNNNHAIAIVLQENRFVLNSMVDESGRIELGLTVNGPGKIKLDWADGTSEEWEFTEATFKNFGHTYSFPSGSFMPVVISGDLEKISKLSAQLVEHLDLSRLPNLAGLSVSESNLAVLDISQNLSFENVSLSETTVSDFIVGEGKANMNRLYMHDVMTASTIDEMITEYYTNAVAQDIRGEGRILHIWGEETLPLTETQKTMLRDLRDNYGWEVLVEYQSF